MVGRKTKVTITVAGRISYDNDKQFILDSTKAIADWSRLKPGFDDVYKTVSIEITHAGETIVHEYSNVFAVSYREYRDDGEGSFIIAMRSAMQIEATEAKASGSLLGEAKRNGETLTNGWRIPMKPPEWANGWRIPMKPPDSAKRLVDIWANGWSSYISLPTSEESASLTNYDIERAKVYNDVIDKLNVTEKRKYFPEKIPDPDDKTKTITQYKCSVFVQDVCREMNAPFVDMNANQTYEWLAGKAAKEEGWIEVTAKEAQKAQDYANKGYLTIVSSKSDEHPGHMQVVRPVQEGREFDVADFNNGNKSEISKNEYNIAKHGPIVAQAGVALLDYAPSAQGYGAQSFEKLVKKGDIKYYVYIPAKPN
ncbi:MAG: hypothetical protein FWH57_11875 [Oscillospiraceae bacterium]|nr:hypothetical protein [Oscillospiraceae bacterium]